MKASFKWTCEKCGLGVDPSKEHICGVNNPKIKKFKASDFEKSLEKTYNENVKPDKKPKVIQWKKDLGDQFPYEDTKPSWEETWAVIQEREYDNCLTKGLTDIQAQAIIDKHDDWFRQTIKEERQSAFDEVEKGLPKELEETWKRTEQEPTEDEKAFEAGYNQCLADIKESIKKTKEKFL